MADKKKIDNQDTIAYKVLVEPWVTEETTRIAELDKYSFKVSRDAKKDQIRRAIEDIYKVDVVSVNTINVPRKKRVRGKTVGWKPGFKKAIITIKKGDKIDIFEGK